MRYWAKSGAWWQLMSRNKIVGLLIFAIVFAYFPNLPAKASPHQQNDGLHIVYINDQGGLSIVTRVEGVFTAPLPFASPNALPVYSLDASPDGQKIAVIYASPFADGSAVQLKVYQVPNATVLLEQNLLPDNFPTFSEPLMGDPLYEMARAVTEIEWSPDGQKLAFISGQDGVSADVHLANFPSDAPPVSLESQPGAAAFLSWSPDGTWLVYSDLETFGGAGIVSQGIYALNLTDSQNLTLDEGSIYPQDISRVGWRGNDTFLFSPPSYTAGARGLYGWQLPNGTVTPYLPAESENTLPVYDSTTDTAVFVVPNQETSLSFEPGMYILSLVAETPNKLMDGNWYDARLVNHPHFQLIGETGEILINVLTLQQTVLPIGELGTFVSPNTQVAVTYFSDGIQLSALDGSNAARLPIEGALPPTWSADGTWFITYGFTDAGAGLLLVDVQTRVATLLDTTAAIGGLWAFVYDRIP